MIEEHIFRGLWSQPGSAERLPGILIFVDFSVFNLFEWTNIDGLTEERIYPDYHFKYQQGYSNIQRPRELTR